MERNGQYLLHIINAVGNNAVLGSVWLNGAGSELELLIETKCTKSQSLSAFLIWSLLPLHGQVLSSAFQKYTYLACYSHVRANVDSFFQLS